MGTKSDILNLLQREVLSVAELCERLDITRNAINVQLRQLEAEGLVRRVRRLATKGVGKPAAMFEAAPGSEDVGSAAYQVFIPAFLLAFRDKLGPKVLADVLEETGRRLAREAGLSSPADVKTGLRTAMAVVDALGASTEAVQQPGSIMVRNYSCPISSAVRADPCVCRAMAAFFSEATGCPVTEHCLREGRLICQYIIATNGPKQRSVESG